MYDDLVKKIRHCATDPMHCLSCGEVKDGRCFKRLMTQAADALEELSAIRDEQKAQIILMAAEIEEQQPRWIPVTERLPEESGRYLVIATEPWFGSTSTEIMRYRAGENLWVYDGRITEAKITRWMPLPESPKEE